MNNIKVKLWDFDINRFISFMPEQEATIIADYFYFQKKLAYSCLKTINERNFDHHLSTLVGIDNKLQLLFNFLNPSDFLVVNEKAHQLIELIENDYIIYHHEQLSQEFYPYIEHSLLYCIE